MSLTTIPISPQREMPLSTPDIIGGFTRVSKSAPVISRAELRGKFLWAGQEKLYVRGVTYGTFRPNPDGSAFPSSNIVEQDFLQMSANGVNAVRTYTAPPRWLLDLAQRCNLRVLVGLQGERHYTFLHERRTVRDIRKQIRSGVRECSGHPAVLGYVVANEIPACVVRWHGARSTEKFITDLCADV